MRREHWVEGRFSAAEGEELLTRTAIGTATDKDEQWSSRWRFSVHEPDAGKTPTALEVRFYLPGKPGETVELPFENLALPPRQEAPRPRD